MNPRLCSRRTRAWALLLGSLFIGACSSTAAMSDMRPRDAAPGEVFSCGPRTCGPFEYCYVSTSCRGDTMLWQCKPTPSSCDGTLTCQCAGVYADDVFTHCAVSGRTLTYNFCP